MNPIALSDVKKGLLKAFVALGPLGNLLTPQIFSHSFRTYYLILLAFPLFYIPLQKRLLKIIVISAPLFIYCFFSALFINQNEQADFPIFRCFLLYFQFLFVFGVSTTLTDDKDGITILKLYIKFFFASIIIGYIMYLGFYLHFLPAQLLEHFSVISQHGYGFLRFSPGSYPNEYGMVSSFVLSILTWSLMESAVKLFSKLVLIPFYLLTFGALLLTTTRTAYISYFFILCFMAWKKRCLIKTMAFVAGIFATLATILNICGISILNVFAVGFALENYDNGSLNERFAAWSKGLESFQDNPLWGGGFASAINIHNLYLQVLFELGIGGIITILGAFLFSFLEKGYIRLNRTASQTNEQRFLHMIAISGIVHVLLFATTNHNLNHHLTWIVIFLCYSLSIRSRSIASPNLPAFS